MKYMFMVVLIANLLSGTAVASSGQRGARLVIGETTFAPICENKSLSDGEQSAINDAMTKCHPLNARRISQFSTIDHAMGCDWQTLAAIFICE